jgi:hypothetical protein
MQKPEGEVTKLVPRAAWKGCDKCWREGVGHNGRECAFGGPCYIRFAWCEHRNLFGMRLRPDGRTKFKGVRKDSRGRWVWSNLEIVSDTIAERDRQKMHALDAIIKIHNDLPALKKDLKRLRRDIEGLIERKDEARNHLYLVVNAVNRNLTLQEIKKIAVKGMAKSK